MKKFGIIEMLGVSLNVNIDYWPEIYVSTRKITCGYRVKAPPLSSVWANMDKNG